MKIHLIFPLLIFLSSCSFYKYPSKTQAKLACDEWVSEGGFYALKITEFEKEFDDFRVGEFIYDDLTDEELKQKIKEDDSKLWEGWNIKVDSSYVENRFKILRSKREIINFKNTRNYPEQTLEKYRRYCIEEKETKQFLGYEFNVSKGKIINIKDCDPKYGEDINFCFSDSTIKEKTIKKNFYF